MKMPSEQELYDLREYMLLPLVLTVLHKDKEAIEMSNVKFKEPYLSLIEKSMKAVDTDLYKLRDSFRKAGIKITRELKQEHRLYWEYKCRGYIGDSFMLWHLVKAEVQVRVEKYLGS